VAGSGYLDAPTALLTGLGLLVRCAIVLGWLKLDLSPRIVNALTVAYIGFYPLDWAYVSRDFLTATVHLVFFLAIVKVLSAVTDRDYFYVKIIAFLELLAASILSSSANYFLFLAMFLFFGVGTFAASEIRRSARNASDVVRLPNRRLNFRLTGLTVFTVFGILILTATLFFLLPRTARAAFQRFIPQRYHMPGFSNEVTLGQLGELKMRHTAVMHARVKVGQKQMDGPLPIKWRGSALMQFDGKRWYNDAGKNEVLRVEGGVLRLASLEETLQPRSRISYEVAMQETTSDALFLAGIPESIQILVPLVIRTASSSYRLGLGAPDRLRYVGHSVLETDDSPRKVKPLSSDLRIANLQLPKLDPRIGDLARELTLGTKTDLQRIRIIDSYLRKTYPYTTDLPQIEPADPVAYFMFERKKGHCEYFASALAVMLRNIGIPARVATGFQNGIYNHISGWYLVRASDAHSWVEAWVDGRGWMTFDPTPPDPNPPGTSIVTRIQLYMDAMQVFWQDWVLSYDIDRQLTLAARMEQSSRSFQLRWLDGSLNGFFARVSAQAADAKRHAAKAVFGIVFLTLLIVFGPQLWRRWRILLRVNRARRGQASASDATLMYERMLALLRRKGIEKPVWLTPREFARSVPDRRAASLIEEFTAAYNDLRFGNRPDAAPRLVVLLEQLAETPVSVRRN
jgi:transglutaminase-like putative cysteine protease